MNTTVRRVVLLGYMCSGKSTVGAALARRLEWAFVDLDAEIEHHTGQPVKSLVAAAGEQALRALEEELTLSLAGAEEVVLAPGGGWITRPERLGVLGEGTLSVWLRTSPEEVVRRLMADPAERPFRSHPDPMAAVDAMIQERQPLYDLADLVVDTDGATPEAIAFRLEAVVRGA